MTGHTALPFGSGRLHSWLLLKWGLKHQQNLGVDPFKLGIVGGTDMDFPRSRRHSEALV